jgi:signal transduction histidine kinase
MARWSERHRQVLDILKAALFIGFFTLLQAETTPQSLLLPQSTNSAIVWSLIYIVPLSVRRTHADSGAITFILLAILQILAGPVVILADFVAVIMLYSAIVYGSRLRTRRYIVIALGMGALVSILNAVAQHHQPLFAQNSTANGTLPASSYASDIIVIFIAIETLLLSAIAMGYWRRARFDQLHLMRERNRALEESQKEEAHLATLAERSRIARDMHDLVAHTLSIIIVQADGGRYAGVANPSIAAGTMLTIRDEANHALTSMNGLLGTLGEDDEKNTLARRARPDLTVEYGSIDALIHQAQTASGARIVIERSVHGKVQHTALTSEISAALFHVVQEALSNVRKYAAVGSTKVHVDIVERWSPTAVSLSVTDDGQGARAAADGHHPGYGLIGMNERITAQGGTLHAGTLGDAADGGVESTADHGFSLTATIPLTPVVTSQEHQGRNRNRASAASEDTNAIERVSTWTQSHFAVVDLAGATLLALFLALNEWFYGSAGATGPTVAFHIIFSIAFALPLAMRRTRPQLSAATIAGILILAMLAGATTSGAISADNGPALPVDGVIIALFALYSVMVYGPKSARRWVYPASACIIGLAVTVVWQSMNISNTNRVTLSVAQLEEEGVARYTTQQMAFICTGAAVLITSVVLGTIFFALWKRARGADIVLLRSREEALLHQRDRQAALAANLERARISEQIQHEVTQTLGTVLDSANSWIPQLETIDDPAIIQTAFSTIGETGRQALAQMRELLGILRQNETASVAARPQLRPIMASDTAHS